MGNEIEQRAVYEKLLDIMLLLYLKHHNYKENVTDIPAWTSDLVSYLKDGQIPEGW